ncbi:MAG: EVE domain-containing protein [Proteobacteria bacterium]|nr:EVE domain-containing protein [Pseudomonadota bacterium]
MAYWLLKSEPDAWSWDQMVKAGAKGTAWTGIRNHTAKLNMKKMKKGDRGFFYHSNVGKEIVGIVEVIKEAYADPTAETGSPWVCVDVKAVIALKTPVTLAAIKAEPKLSEIQLLKQSRLSLPAITEAEWKLLCKMGGR